MSRPASTWPRIIVHADMDAFYAAIEQHDRPELRGKPLLIGGDSPRSVVTTASYEARPFGVGSAMSMVVAKRKCPQALIIPPRMHRYAEVSRQIMEVFDTFSPRVEALSLDEAFLDMTGAERLFGTPLDMAAAIKWAVRERTGLCVSVGVAASKYVAKVASDVRKPDGLCVVEPEDTLAFLHPLPISRLWGVGKRGEEQLRALGLATIADVAAADPTWLRGVLGSMGDHIYRLAQGDDPRPVVPDREAQSSGAENTLDEDVRGAAAIRPHLMHAADRIAWRLRRGSLAAGGVRVKLKTNRFALHTRQVALRPPSQNAGDLLDAALALLEHFDLREPMRLVGLAAFDLRDLAAPVQGELFGQVKRQKQQQLDAALDKLRERFGKGTVKRGSDV